MSYRVPLVRAKGRRRRNAIVGVESLRPSLHSNDMSDLDIWSVSRRNVQVISVGRAQAEQFFHKVTVAGLSEVHKSTTKLESVLWLVVLLTTCALSVRDIASFLAKEYAAPDVRYETYLVNSDRLRVSNVSVCISAKLKTDRLRELFVLSNETLRRIARLNMTMDEVYDGVASYYAPNIAYKEIPLAVKRIYRDVYADEINKKVTDDYAKLIGQLAPNCQESLKNCQFGGRLFNCCDKVLFMMNEDSFCFKLALTEDNEFDQTEPGMDGGLIFDAVLDPKYSDFIDDIAADGFYIYIDGAPTPFSSPVLGWSNSHVFIRTVPRQRQLTADCYEVPPPSKYTDYYDPTAFYCKVDTLIDKVRPNFGCDLPCFSYFPNSSRACDLNILVFMRFFMHNESSEAINADRNSNLIQQMMATKGNSLIQTTDVRSIVRDLYYHTDGCLPLCKTWEFDLYVSYLDIEHKQARNDVTTRISVYYGDFNYEIVQELPNTNNYIRFAQIGSILGAYNGLSVITFVQVIVYAFCCCYRR